MDITQVRQEKEELERDISKLISNFQANTDASVVEVTLSKICTSRGPGWSLISVNVNISL